MGWLELDSESWEPLIIIILILPLVKKKKKRRRSKQGGKTAHLVDLAAIVNCAEEIARGAQRVCEKQGVAPVLEVLEEGRQEADAAREVTTEAAHGPARLRERGDLRRHTRRHGRRLRCRGGSLGGWRWINGGN